MKGAAALITGAAAVLIGLVYVSSRGRRPLAPADFTAAGPDALQFCSDTSPKFIPVANKTSPVVLTVVNDRTIRLGTAGGKPIGPGDLTRAPRLFAIDGEATALAVSTLAPAGSYGEWTGRVPAGATTVFADIFPSATGQEMYVEGAVHASSGADDHSGAQPQGGASGGAPGADPVESRLRDRAPGAASEVNARRMDSATGWTMLMSPPRALVRDPILLSVRGPAASRVAEEAVFDLAPGGATGFALVKAGVPITFDDPGKFAVWILGAESEPLQRFTLSVSP